MSTASTRRIAIIGDVGGHSRCFDACLEGLGADLVSHRLPADLTVVQVGDLIGAKPDDRRIIASVDRWQELNPGRWVQLVGNWEVTLLEGRYLRRSRATGPVPEPDAIVVERLRHWKDSAQLRVAVAVRSSRGEDALVTHAGMTSSFWKDHCDSDPAADVVATRMNELGFDEGSPVRLAGEMCGARNGDAGPLWASGREVWQSWLGNDLPFNQVHGHTSPYFWGKHEWNDDISDELKSHVVLKSDCRHLWFEQGAHRIVGIDPGLWDRSRPGDLYPLVLHNASIL